MTTLVIFMILYNDQRHIETSNTDRQSSRNLSVACKWVWWWTLVNDNPNLYFHSVQWFSLCHVLLWIYGIVVVSLQYCFNLENLRWSNCIFHCCITNFFGFSGSIDVPPLNLLSDSVSSCLSNLVNYFSCQGCESEWQWPHCASSTASPFAFPHLINIFLWTSDTQKEGTAIHLSSWAFVCLWWWRENGRDCFLHCQKLPLEPRACCFAITKILHHRSFAFWHWTRTKDKSRLWFWAAHWCFDRRGTCVDVHGLRCDSF